MSAREAYLVGITRKFHKDGKVTVYKGTLVQMFRNRLDKDGVIYTVERRVRAQPGSAPGASRHSSTTNVSQVMGYINSGQIHEEYMRSYADSDEILKAATAIALDRSQSSEARMDALRQLNGTKNLVCMARLKKMEWIFTKEDDLVLWPGQSKDAATECRMYRYRLRQIYDPRTDYQMQHYSNDKFRGHLVTLIRMANLGDWIAAELLSSEGLLPESHLPDPKVLLQHPVANQYCLMVYAVYAVRRWKFSLAEKLWERCTLPQAAVQLALSRRAKDNQETMRMLQEAPECRAKHIAIAIEKRDGASLLKLDDRYNAGLAYARSGNMDLAKQLLLEEAKLQNEAASVVLLSLDPELLGDLEVLKQLDTLCGKRHLAHYMIRHGDRQGGVSLLHDLGLMGARELVEMGEMSQSDYNEIIKDLQSRIRALKMR